MKVLSMNAGAVRAALAALVFYVLAGPGPARAQAPVQAAAPASAVLKDGGMVQFCGDGAPCRLNKHPAAVGKVREIVAGDFINGAATSWIALGERAVSLCYLPAKTGAITCAPIVNGPDFAKGTQISYISFEDGRHTLKFSARNGNDASWEANYSPYPFMAGLGTATELLKQHATRHGNGKLPNPALASGKGTDLCAIGDNGGVTCTGNDTPVDSSAPATAGEAAGVSAERASLELAGAPPEPNTITTVETGIGTQAPYQRCAAAMDEQVKSCDLSNNALSEKSQYACMTAAQAHFQECMAGRQADRHGDGLRPAGGR
ncbi:hypothetical protein [Massilia sp. DWR3-1-1]|uniref:hypothetical protein n=1 Tax=Massilia sp. DWR3-1-1 TaxID=2804559 RepID=UPI003CFAAEE4